MRFDKKKNVMYQTGQDHTRHQDSDHQTSMGKVAWSSEIIRHWCRLPVHAGQPFVSSSPVCLFSGPPCVCFRAISCVGNPVGSTPGPEDFLFAMGLVALFAPGHARVAGAIGVILSLVSGMTALGGFGIGINMGIMGVAL